MSVRKRIYVLFALLAVSFAASACADATSPSSPNQAAIQRDGTSACDQQGSNVKC